MHTFTAFKKKGYSLMTLWSFLVRQAVSAWCEFIFVLLPLHFYLQRPKSLLPFLVHNLATNIATEWLTILLGVSMSQVRFSSWRWTILIDAFVVIRTLSWIVPWRMQPPLLYHSIQFTTQHHHFPQCVAKYTKKRTVFFLLLSASVYLHPSINKYSPRNIPFN
jgi:hypothetical protein